MALAYGTPNYPLKFQHLGWGHLFFFAENNHHQPMPSSGHGTHLFEIPPTGGGAESLSIPITINIDFIVPVTITSCCKNIPVYLAVEMDDALWSVALLRN
ncbi:hypothetical protein OUZ56_008436 [Daphnia magna]|uniref:Uncharacterized protein n=1 Tax=Daphnia magna TaxID=35525 RepID=A0ABR0ACZ2_9CRUS|nr:hypothetical protein OUZ56_008436 [Daphnia magna]